MTALSKSGQAPDGQVLETQEIQHLPYHLRFLPGYPSPWSTDIEARSGNKKLLVQVKSAIYPNQPSSLSWEEERNIKSRAIRIGAEAWEARVLLDESLNPMDIKWRKLN